MYLGENWINIASLIVSIVALAYMPGFPGFAANVNMSEEERVERERVLDTIASECA